MTEKQLLELFRVWRKRLGLDLWDIEVVIEPCESKHSFMEIHRSRAYNCAKIFVQPWVLTGEIPQGVIDLELTDKRIEAKVVHELLHCHTSRMKAVVEDRLDGLLHRDVSSLIEEEFSDHEEMAIESLAQALVRSWHP